MKYDFTVVPDRSNCGSSKWDAVPGASTEKVPLSTADMEFPVAPEIRESLKELADTTILGYTRPTAEYYDAVIGWMKRRHNWEITKEMIVNTPGVVYALGAAVAAVTQPGESILILTPVYYPFDMAVVVKERNIIYSELVIKDGKYVIDYEDLEKKAAEKDCKALMFCNPHNPVGRVWTKEELEKVVDICAENDMVIIDDEIHNDLIMPGVEHTVMATVNEKAKDICIVCTAPSKTFNLAGLQCSNIIIPNPQLRAKFSLEILMNLSFSLNIFAYKACETAYTECEEWLDEVISVIDGNAKYVTDFMAENFPEVKVYPLEGTYLLWMDLNALGMTHKELEVCMKEDAGLYLDEGYMFGRAGRGFERWNIACARSTIEKSCARFKAAIEKKRKEWAENGKPYHKTLACGDKLEGFVYDTETRSQVDLAQECKAPTVLLFLRYYACPVCQTILYQLKELYPTLQANGIDLKVVLQTSPEELQGASQGFPFELICDPDAVLYDRYNVFEADGIVGMIDGKAELLQQMGGIKGAATAMFSSEKSGSSKARQMQLPAMFVVMPDMTVCYAKYGRHVADIPGAEELQGLC